ncbi:hypothetical protein ScPMuIL_010127 [Solemya velum]
MWEKNVTCAVAILVVYLAAEIHGEIRREKAVNNFQGRRRDVEPLLFMTMLLSIGGGGRKGTVRGKVIDGTGKKNQKIDTTE